MLSTYQPYGRRYDYPLQYYRDWYRPRTYTLGDGEGSGAGEMAPVYEPFARAHNKGCVYYGVRGNGRFNFLYDKSCTFDGAADFHLSKGFKLSRGTTLRGLGELLPSAKQAFVNGLVRASQADDKPAMRQILRSVPVDDRVDVANAAVEAGGNSLRILAAMHDVALEPPPLKPAENSGASKLAWLAAGLVGGVLVYAGVNYHRAQQEDRTVLDARTRRAATFHGASARKRRSR